MSERQQLLRELRQEDRKYNIQRERQRLRRDRRTARIRRMLDRRAAYERETAVQRPVRTRLAAQSVAAVCALALLLGLRALPYEGARQLTDNVRRVATAQLDVEELGQDLGQLEFVSKLVPKSVQVFWTRTSGQAPDALQLPFADAQPALETGDGLWLIGSGAVHAGADGEVLSVTRSQMGGYCVRIRHAGGLESVYEPLVGVRVAPGDSVRRGESFAVPVEEDGVSKLFLRLELGGRTVDAKEYLEP